MRGSDLIARLPRAVTVTSDEVREAQATIDHCAEFDLIAGGGLDIAFLGFGECDATGSVNASRFGERVPGCGGFIDISQGSRKVVFTGTFTSGGLATRVADGRLVIEREGKFRKFVERIGQLTFNGPQTAARGQEVLFVTERCVLRLKDGGLALAEVAPGVDVERDVLALLPFPVDASSAASMDPAIFLPGPMGLRSRLLDLRIAEQEAERSRKRKSQVSTGDRSAKIRTYNYPQSRVTDHRIGLTLYKLDSVLQGSMQELIGGLTTHYQAQALQNVEAVTSH